MQCKHLIDAIERLHQLPSLNGRVEQARRRPAQQVVRVCVQRQRSGRAAEAVSQLARAAQQRPVAEVDTVKKAKRDHAFHLDLPFLKPVIRRKSS